MIARTVLEQVVFLVKKSRHWICDLDTGTARCAWPQACSAPPYRRVFTLSFRRSSSFRSCMAKCRGFGAARGVRDSLPARRSLPRARAASTRPAHALPGSYKLTRRCAGAAGKPAREKCGRGGHNLGAGACARNMLPAPNCTAIEVPHAVVLAGHGCTGSGTRRPQQRLAAGKTWRLTPPVGVQIFAGGTRWRLAGRLPPHSSSVPRVNRPGRATAHSAA